VPSRFERAIPVSPHAAGQNMEPLKVDEVIRREKWKDLLVKGFKFLFQKILSESTERWCRNKRNVKCFIFQIMHANI